MLLIRGLIGGLFQLAILGALLLIPAGTWQWPQAIQFLAAYGLVMFVSIVAMARFAPASLEARLEPPSAKNQPRADRVATILVVGSILAWFVFIPIDVFRLQIFSTPSPAVSILGAVVGFAGYGIVMVALFQNAFAVPTVRVQSERNQVLIDTGLYGIVRHPFYLGLLVSFVGLAMWLESSSVLTVSIVFAALTVRIRVEEKTLRQELPGYDEYTQKVRYRLVPYVW
jgi:protein-S-isoprenylcysteine O-methyltransferase Ste14